MRRFFGALLLILGLSLVLLSIENVFEPYSSPSRRSAFSNLWKRDLVQLEAEKKLPRAFFNLRTVRIQPLNPEAEKLMSHLEPPFKAKEAGQFDLEVMIDLWQDEEGFGVLMLYSIFDAQKNLVWEMSRTLTF